MKEFKCIKCGKCCKEIPIDIVASDIIRWYNDGRWDILREISYINNYPKNGIGGFYIAKTTFNPKQDCPFLINNECAIHDTKPLVCKDAPTGHDKFDICPVFSKKHIKKRDRNLVKSEQYKEFKATYNNKKELLDILCEVR